MDESNDEDLMPFVDDVVDIESVDDIGEVYLKYYGFWLNFLDFNFLVRLILIFYIFTT